VASCEGEALALTHTQGFLNNNQAHACMNFKFLYSYMSLSCLQPFIDGDQPILALLPDTRQLYLPLSVLLVATLGSILAYVGCLMVIEPLPAGCKED
jgi:hypothetical protein